MTLGAKIPISKKGRRGAQQKAGSFKNIAGKVKMLLRGNVKNALAGPSRKTYEPGKCTAFMPLRIVVWTKGWGGANSPHSKKKRIEGEKKGERLSEKDWRPTN